MTPRLAARPTGFTTHGRPTSRDRPVDVSRSVGDREPRLGHPGALQPLAHRRLVARRGHRVGIVVREAESNACRRRDFHAGVVDGDDRVDGRALVEGDDRVDRGGDVRHRHHEGAVAHSGRQGLLFLGSDDHLDAEPGCGPDEVGRAVRRRGQQEEHTRHAPIMAA